MISLIIGNKGSGKTKKLIDLVNNTAESSKGNVVCIEKGKNLNSAISNSVRLIDIEEYGIEGCDAYFGFLSGLCAGNYDITDVFADATFKIIGKDFDNTADFIRKISKLSEESNVKFVFTLSCAESELPDSIFKYAGKM